MFRSTQCVFIGYSAQQKGVKCLDVAMGRVYISRDVVFDETAFPFAKLHPNAGALLRKEILLLPSTLTGVDHGGENNSTDQLASNHHIMPEITAADLNPEEEGNRRDFMCPLAGDMHAHRGGFAPISSPGSGRTAPGRASGPERLKRARDQDSDRVAPRQPPDDAWRTDIRAPEPTSPGWPASASPGPATPTGLHAPDSPGPATSPRSRSLAGVTESSSRSESPAPDADDGSPVAPPPVVSPVVPRTRLQKGVTTRLNYKNFSKIGMSCTTGEPNI